MAARGLFPDSPALYYGKKAYKRSSRALRRSGPKFRPTNLQVSMVPSKIVIYKPILNFALNHPQGVVGRHLHGIANRITQLAKLQVGKKTGRLAKSIKFEHLARNSLGPGIKVGGYTPYALLHHRGSKPHTILPRKPGGNLVFRKGSRIIHTPVVRHPGTKPNPYLTTPMRKVVLASS